MAALLAAWHDRGDAAVLAEPAPQVFSHGDGKAVFYSLKDRIRQRVPAPPPTAVAGAGWLPGMTPGARPAPHCGARR
jgi:hypothetical protein